MGSLMNNIPGMGGGGGSGGGGSGGGMGGGFPGMPQQNGTEQSMPSQNIMGMQVPDFMGEVNKAGDNSNADNQQNAANNSHTGATQVPNTPLPSMNPNTTYYGAPTTQAIQNMPDNLNTNAQANNAYGLSLFQQGNQQPNNYGASLGQPTNQNQYGLGSSPLGNIDLGS